MVKLIAVREVRYAGVNRVPGTDSAEFEATEKDAKLLLSIKKCVRTVEVNTSARLHVAPVVPAAQVKSDPPAPAPAPRVEQSPAPLFSDPPQYERRDETAEKPADDPTSPPGRRRYRRRDVVAED